MARHNQRGNREKRKPKSEKKKTSVQTPSLSHRSGDAAIKVAARKKKARYLTT